MFCVCFNEHVYKCSYADCRIADGPSVALLLESGSLLVACADPWESWESGQWTAHTVLMREQPSVPGDNNDLSKARLLYLGLTDDDQPLVVCTSNMSGGESSATSSSSSRKPTGASSWHVWVRGQGSLASARLWPQTGLADLPACYSANVACMHLGADSHGCGLAWLGLSDARLLLLRGSELRGTWDLMAAPTRVETGGPDEDLVVGYLLIVCAVCAVD